MTPLRTWLLWVATNVAPSGDEPNSPINRPRLYACGGCRHISGSSTKHSGRRPSSNGQQAATYDFNPSTSVSIVRYPFIFVGDSLSAWLGMSPWSLTRRQTPVPREISGHTAFENDERISENS